MPNLQPKKVTGNLQLSTNYTQYVQKWGTQIIQGNTGDTSRKGEPRLGSGTMRADIWQQNVGQAHDEEQAKWQAVSG